MNSKLRTFLFHLKQEGIQRNIPNISWMTGEILQFLLRTSNAKNILEIGCANGFSTVFLADITAKNKGKVVTCDVSLPSFQEAQKNVSLAGFSNIVEFRFGDGAGICNPSEVFDFIFIDAQKDKTHIFFEYSKKFLSPSGIICIDNTKKFSQKMSFFAQLRSQQKDFLFFDIGKEDGDSMTLCFRTTSPINSY